MERKVFSSGSPWEPVVGYSRAVRVGQHVFISGTTATDPSGAVLGAGDMPEQTRVILRKIETALNRAGAKLRHVVRTRMFVTDIARWEEAGKVHGEFFAGILPVTTMVQVSGLIDPQMLIEIEAEAIIDA